MLKKCLDKCNQMTRSGAAGLNIPKSQYFDQMTFLHVKSVNRIAGTTYLNPRRYPQKFWQMRANDLQFLSLVAAIATTFLTFQKITKNKKDAQILCNQMHLQTILRL